jgi:hypothetical protein
MAAPMVALSEGGPYEDLAKSIETGNRKYYTGAASNSPQVIANIVLKAINSANPKTRYAVSKMAKPTLFLRRWLSDRAFDKMLKRMLS